MKPAEKPNPTQIPKPTVNAENRPAKTACNSNKIGAKKTNENSIGSVIPVKKLTPAAEPKIPAYSARRILSLIDKIIAAQAADKPNIIIRKNTDWKIPLPPAKPNLASAYSFPKKALISPLTVVIIPVVFQSLIDNTPLLSILYTAHCSVP